MVNVLGIDPGESAGYAWIAEAVALSPEPFYPELCLRWDVIAVEGQYLSRSKHVHHKGRTIAVSSASILTLAFHAGLLAARAGSGRLLRLAPDVWRALLWPSTRMAGTVAVNRLREELGALAEGHTDDEVEAYGLARCAALIGPTAKSGTTPDGRTWRAVRQPGWEDVRIVTPRASARRLGRAGA